VSGAITRFYLDWKSGQKRSFELAVDYTVRSDERTPLSGTRLAALERDEKDRLAAELAVAKQRIADQRGIITWASTQSPVVLPLRFFNGKVISARDTSAHKATGLEFPVLVDVRSKPVSSAVVLH
jgi:hypothetical protein